MKKLSSKQKQERLDEVYRALDELVHVGTTSLEECEELLGEVASEVDGRLEGIKSDLENRE